MLSALLLLAACCPDPATSDSSDDLGDPVDLVPYIDPFIATGGIGFEVGCAYPGANVPFGLVKASPDTADKNGSDFRGYRGGGYYYEDVYVQGFSHMHMHGIGSVDYGVVSFMPGDGMDASRTTEQGYRARFDHEGESASAGRYAVTLQDPAVFVELTATEHTGLHRLTFARSVAEPTVLFDLCHTLGSGICLGGEVQVSPEDGTLHGWMYNDGEMAAPFKVWFSAVLDRPPVAWGTWTNSSFDPDATQVSALDPNLDDPTGVGLGAWLTFDVPVVRLRVAMSTVDAEGAEANLQAEHDGFDFDATAAAAEQRWRDALSVVDVWGGTEDERTICATSTKR